MHKWVRCRLIQADRITGRTTDEKRQKDGEQTNILRENRETERGNGGREGIRDGEKRRRQRDRHGEREIG